MTSQVTIGVYNQEEAALIQQELVSRGIRVNRLSRDVAVRFGMKIGPTEVSVQEFIEVVEAGPRIVDAIFDVIERFRDRKNQLSLFVDGQQVRVVNKQSLQALLDKSGIKKPAGFQRFERGKQ